MFFNVIELYKNIDEFDNEIENDNVKKKNFDERNKLLRKMSRYFYIIKL